jgi:transposase
MSEDYCNDVAERLISYWEFHRGFNANISDLAHQVNVSRDTVYRWLNRKALPKLMKAHAVEEWLRKQDSN